jgi:hypothetical protein
MRNSYRLVCAIITLSLGIHLQAKPVLPENFDMPRELLNVVTEVYAQSATFRAQCDRLSQTPNLRVTMRFDINMRSSCRAYSVIKRRQGQLCAEVHLPVNTVHLPELIAHEFEHLLEQVDHLDLRMLARVRGSGVHEVEADLFETDRAQEAGKMVAEEMRRRREPRPGN